MHYDLKSLLYQEIRFILESTVVTHKRGIWKFDCKASVEGEIIGEANILCADRPK